MSGPGQNTVDIDALLDLTEYDNFQSPATSVSPSGTSKATFASPISAAVAAPATTTAQSLSGPSHNYDMYRQQTGFVPGAIANTMAVNQTNNTGYQDFRNIDYLTTFSPEADLFDFNTSPSQATLGASDMDMDFESQTETQQFFTVDPSSIEQENAGLPSPPVLPTQNNGRLWPGAHSQAALAKAQQQQRQQQQIIQQQQQAQRQASQPKSRGKAPQPTDPIVEQKITQLLNSMRAKPSMPESQATSPMANLPRSKKDEEEMDEDERLLASEEGKKLSSKERRQLRNKVSARAFRSRRKEYITQLETEIANKVSENGDLRAQNRALVDENKRLTDLTRMLLSSPSFSNFLDNLSSNPTAVQQTPQLKVEPQPEQRQVPKDINPYNAQQSSQHQIGMAMIPEQNMDFSMLTLDGSFNFQPQVFVVDTPELPDAIDASVLSGKTSNFAEPIFDSEEEKLEVPAIERPVEKPEVSEPVDAAPIDLEFESDPEFALFHTETATTTTEQPKEFDSEGLSHVDIFGGVESEKVLARLELVDAGEEECIAALAMARVQRISASCDAVTSRTLLKVKSHRSTVSLLPSMADVVQPSEPTAPELYVYTPFTDNFTIRILTLEPGTGNDPLVGHLGFENLDLSPQYEAISYCWGTGGRTSEIICDGKPLPLTESIEGALRRMRHATTQRRLWADQVCINQDDIAERSQQFNRIWIVQEIGTAAPATLYWGDAEIDWEILSSVAGILNTTYHFLRSRFAVFTPNIRYLYQRFVEPDEAYDVNHNRAAFIYELHRARHLLSKDPRDHVYAFLGHFSIHTGSSSLAELVADYSRSIEDIYYDVAVRELSGCESLLLLSACHAIPVTYKKRIMERGDLPTWVPDWRVVPLHLMGTPVTPHRASGEYRPQLCIDEETRALHIYGVRLDRIRRPSWIFWNNAFHFRRNNPFRLPIEALWRDICGRNQPFNLRQRYRNGDSAFFALVQTLTNACIGADRSRLYESIPKEEWLANGAAYLVRALDKPGAVSPEIQELAQMGDGFKWSHEATLVTRYRGFAITFGGWFVVGPDIMQAGDVVVVLYGGRTPFLLRRKDDGTWILVGECYVHGMMNGEVFDLDGVEEEEFVIV
ncbi:heterokaryon incompatibility het-6 [Fusarium pseudocircinatum]|uniref:Heterokaryon incompatibility het-6 n=1 Tax=Fusarium pseudocircinatum TaxID=56676 RepID=A0A8H5PLH4_9HYPO|nr:heterokaryon incompatibility het-6 [Fusarium pseudocircinatum]